MSIYKEINNHTRHERITKIHVFEKSNTSWKIVATDCGNFRQKKVMNRPENVINILNNNGTAVLNPSHQCEILLATDC